MPHACSSKLTTFDPTALIFFANYNLQTLYSPFKMEKSAKQRVPVEIWRSILLLAGAGPFLPGPEDGPVNHILVFAGHCATSSAYGSSDGIKRRLRLVCRSWNQLVSSLSFNPFVILPNILYDYEPSVPFSSRTMSAKHLVVTQDFDCVCDTLCCRSAQWRQKRRIAGVNMQPYGIGKFIDDVERAGHPNLAVEIMQIVAHETWPILLIRNSLVNLRALSLSSFAYSSLPMMMEAFPQLTHLELRGPSSTFVDTDFIFPNLHTLVIDLTHLVPLGHQLPLNVQRTLRLPSLGCLVLRGEIENGEVLRSFLPKVGNNLTTLIVTPRYVYHSSHRHRNFGLPAEIWDWCPNLEYIGGVASTILGTARPPDQVQLSTIIIEGLFETEPWISDTKAEIRETSFITGSCANWNFSHFQITQTWKRFQNEILAKPLSTRAEWINFLIPFGLLSRRDGHRLCDRDGVAFDDDRASPVRERLLYESAMLKHKFRTTTKGAFTRGGSARVAAGQLIKRNDIMRVQSAS